MDTYKLSYTISLDKASRDIELKGLKEDEANNIAEQLDFAYEILASKLDNESLLPLNCIAQYNNIRIEKEQ